MIVPIDELLGRLRPSLHEILVSDDALSNVRVAAKLLPEVSGGICLESRLEEGASRVDYMVCCMASDGGPQALAEALVDSHARLPGPLWDGVRAFSREWLDAGSPLSQVSIFWIEYDLEGVQSGVPRPLPFVCIQPRYEEKPPTSRRLTGETLEESLRITWRALEVLQGRPVPSALARTISRCFEVLPDMAVVGHVASLTARGADTVRLAITIPVVELGTYLERIGWPGTRAQIDELVRSWVSSVYAVDLSLDVGESVGSTVGVGMALPGEPRGTWAEGLLQKLVASGLCSPAKRDAVLSWPGTERVVLDGHQWPSKMCRTMGVKLVCRPGQPLAAKAYPYYECRFSLRKDA